MRIWMKQTLCKIARFQTKMTMLNVTRIFSYSVTGIVKSPIFKRWIRASLCTWLVCFLTHKFVIWCICHFPVLWFCIKVEVAGAQTCSSRGKSPAPSDSPERQLECSKNAPCADFSVRLLLSSTVNLFRMPRRWIAFCLAREGFIGFKSWVTNRQTPLSWPMRCIEGALTRILCGRCQVDHDLAALGSSGLRVELLSV